MRLLIAFAVIVTSGLLFGGDFQPFEGPKPIAILIQTDPWAMAIGSDMLRCAVYENGQIIFLKQDGYYEHKLSEKENSEFRKRITSFPTLSNLKQFII